MDSLWRQILCVFIILSLNNVAIFGYNVPAGLSLPSLRFWKEEGKKLVPSPPTLNAIPTDIIPLARAGVPDCKQGAFSKDGTGPPVTSSIVTPQTLPPVPLPPPIINIPLPQKQPCPVPSNHPCPALTTTPSLSGIHKLLPTPPALQVVSPILPDLGINVPTQALENRILPQQAQIAIDNTPPTSFLPHVCLSPPNVQQNLLPPLFETAALISPSQAGVIQVNTYPSAPVLQDYFLQPLSYQTSHNYPTFLPPGTATIIQTVSQFPNHNAFVPISPDVHVCQPGYQVTLLPTVSSVQTASESIASSASYTPTAIPSETYYSDQFPINVQLTSEQSTPIPIPFFPPAPVIMMKSGSNWKKWLPTLLVSLFTRRCQSGGCGSCSSCDGPDNVYVPFPIPVPTNNPIILNDEDDEYDCDEANED